MRLTTASLFAPLALLPFLGGCSKKEEAPPPVTPPPPAETTPPPAAQTTPPSPAAEMPPSELTSTEIAPGKGPGIVAGETATVHYTGWLWDASAPEHKGAQFDSSREGGQPFEFKLGQGQVIKGWDKGVEGMKAGERKLLIIPPDLAYGAKDSPPIPPNSTLIFDVELLSIKK